MSERPSSPFKGFGVWVSRVYGNAGGAIGRMDYFKAVFLLWLVCLLAGSFIYKGQPELVHTINPGLPDEMRKLVLPAVLVPLRLVWAYLDSKRLRSLGLPAVLALLAHALFIADQFFPNFVVPTYAGLAFLMYLACLLLLPPRSRIVGHSRTGRKLTIVDMEEREK